MRYKGKYRLHTPIDAKTNNFPREYNGQFADSDVYIDCINKVQIYSFGHGILQAYIPSLKRGHNIIKAIEETFHRDIIFDVEETDSEILFKFHAKHMEQLEKHLKPKTSGANISPFSSKNLPKNKSYKIPDDASLEYKEIVQKLGQKRIIELTHSTNNFLKSLSTKKNPWENIKADLALKGLRGKEYIHSIGQWSNYITYLKKNLNL